MRYLSLFSGIEAATAAWKPLGWECAGVAEIEPFPCSVLRHHHPEVPNLGDVTKITEHQIKQLGHIDLLVMGSPCTDVSIAGQRKGLKHADGTPTRSGLFFTGMEIFHWAKQHCGTRYLLLENVPGLFSSNQGRDFAAVVEQMAGLDGASVPANGWGTEGAAVGDSGLLEWCCLDAQFFNLAQRRKRVFALLDTGDWSNRPPILLESESLRGDTPPSREAGESVAYDVAPSLTGSGRGVERTGESRGQDPVIAVCPTLRAGGNRTGGDRPPGTDVDTADSLVATTLRARDQSKGVDSYCSDTLITHALRADGFDASEDGTGRRTPLVPVAYRTNAAGQVDFQGQCTAALTMQTDPTSQFIAFSCKDHGADAGDIAPTLRAMEHDGSHANAGGLVAVACFDERNVTSKANRTRVEYGAPSNTLHAAGLSVITPMSVRRITPRECERLMGFPDDYTLVPHRGKSAADGNRYKALGNSMAIPVVSWIGERIQQVENILAA